jgi:hypothetical protein
MFQGLLPPIPNLQLGYLYSFSNNYGAGRVTGDYLKPFSLNKESFVFGEAHVEGWNFWNSGGTNGNSGGRVNNRVDVSLGGGYRKFFGNQALIGVNGFYDTSRLTGQWFSSGSLGFQAAWLLPGSDALDLNFNWYGKLLNGYQWINTFRHGPSNYDFEAGYSHELWNGGPDLRLKIKGYHFDIGSNLNGYTGGAELKSRDGMFVLKYEAGYDRLDNTYQTIGGYVNVGCQLENVIKGESPFTAPTPIFRSPRNLSYMANQPAARNWNQPTAVVLTRPGRANLASAAVGGCALSRNTEGGPVPASYPYLINPFAPVDSAELNPDLYVTVTFTYTNTSDASSIYLEVDSDTQWVDTNTAIPGNSSGIATVQLCVNQSPFVSHNESPYYFLSVNNDSSNSVTITDVIICFNQPDTGGCP